MQCFSSEKPTFSSDVIFSKKNIYQIFFHFSSVFFVSKQKRFFRITSTTKYSLLVSYACGLKPILQNFSFHEIFISQEVFNYNNKNFNSREVFKYNYKNKNSKMVSAFLLLLMFNRPLKSLSNCLCDMIVVVFD